MVYFGHYWSLFSVHITIFSFPSEIQISLMERRAHSATLFLKSKITAPEHKPNQFHYKSVGFIKIQYELFKTSIIPFFASLRLTVPLRQTPSLLMMVIYYCLYRRY